MTYTFLCYIFKKFINWNFFIWNFDVQVTSFKLFPLPFPAMLIILGVTEECGVWKIELFIVVIPQFQDVSKSYHFPFGFQ